MKIIRTSTVPGSLNNFCRGLLRELQEQEGYEVVAVSSPGEALDEVGQREGVRTVAVEMQRHISPLKDLKSLWLMIKVFRRERPQMVHSITPKAGLISMMAAWLCRVPVRVHMFTGLVFPTSTGLKRRILMATDRLTCACATHIIPEGEGVKSDLQRYSITKKPLNVLGHGNIKGIDLKRFDPDNPEVVEASKLLRKPGVFTFIFIGRIVRDKGINELVEAFVRLYRERQDIRLILVGRAEENLDPVAPLTKEIIGMCPGIEAVGEQKDVRSWLAAADCQICPSYREGFPNVVIEAGAMGLPSIVTDINGSREIVIEGKNGTIVPPKDSDALYEAMIRIITDNEWRNSLAANARPLIASRYEQSYVRQCLKDFYKEILKSK